MLVPNLCVAFFTRFVFFWGGQNCKPHSFFVEKPSIWIASNDTNVIAFVSGVRTLPNPKTFHRDGLNNDMHVDRVKTIIVRSRRFLDKKKESTTVVHQGKNKETVGESSFIVKNAYRGYLYCPFYNELSTCASNEWCLYYAHSTERAEKNLIKIDKLNKYSDSRIEYGSKPQWGEIRKNIPISLLPAPPIHSPEH